MLEQINNAGPCATACKPAAGTGKGSTVFGSIIVSAEEHASREAGLPGRVDRETTSCRSCGAETQSIDVCPACADAMREERAAALREQCRIHRVRFVEDLPVSVLEEMQRGRC
jgi:recombinational DNA repair protein RecR